MWPCPERQPPAANHEVERPPPTTLLPTVVTQRSPPPGPRNACAADVSRSRVGGPVEGRGHACLYCQIAGLCVDDFRGRIPAFARTVLPMYLLFKPFLAAVICTYPSRGPWNKSGRIHESWEGDGQRIDSLIGVRLSARCQMGNA